MRKLQSLSEKRIRKIRMKLLTDDNLRKYILKRDNYTCALCDTYFTKHMRSSKIWKKLNDNCLHIHHILSVGSPEGYGLEFEKTNMITICKHCHHEVTGKSKMHVDYFMDIIKDRE